MKNIKNITFNEIKEFFDKLNEEDIKTVEQEINNAKKIFFAARGCSNYPLQHFCGRLGHLGFDVNMVGDTVTRPMAKGDLLICASGSGTTKSILCLAEKAKSLGARVLLLTLSPQSAIGDLSDNIIVLPAYAYGGKSNQVESIQLLGTLYEQALMIFCSIVVTSILYDNNIDKEYVAHNHTNLE